MLRFYDQYIVETVAKELMVDELLTNCFAGNISGNGFQLVWPEQSDLKGVTELILMLQSLKFYIDSQIHHHKCRSISPCATHVG